MVLAWAAIAEEFFLMARTARLFFYETWIGPFRFGTRNFLSLINAKSCYKREFSSLCISGLQFMPGLAK
jgi:hypothetical protein